MTSVIIVNFNHRESLCRCVASVLNFPPALIECIVVDNGSTDGSAEALRNTFNDDRLRIIELPENLGPAAARNRGIDAAGGDFVAFLDNDTVVTDGWLDEPLQRMAEDETIGACQCKLVLLDDPGRIDYVGDYLGSLGFLVLRAESGERDSGQWNEEAEIFSAKSAGMVARRKAVVEAGMFDEDYFIYVEETDLGWRIWLQGYRIIYCPTSVVKHEYSSSRAILGSEQQSRNVKFHGCKNYVMTLIKNLGARHLLTILPVHVFLWCGLAVYEACRGKFRNAGWIFMGLWWNIRHLPVIRRKRRRIQQNRRVSNRNLWPRISRRIGILYYLRKLRIVPGTGHAEGL